MDFQHSDDQRALRSGMRDLLGAVFDRDRMRTAVERGGALDRALWRELGAAGFFALRLPEEDGGVGLGLPEAVLLFEEAGRALLPGPLVATHLAAGRVKGAAEGAAVVTAADGDRPVAHLADADAVLAGGRAARRGGAARLRRRRPARTVDGPAHPAAPATAGARRRRSGARCCRSGARGRARRFRSGARSRAGRFRSGACDRARRFRSGARSGVRGEAPVRGRAPQRCRAARQRREDHRHGRSTRP